MPGAAVGRVRLAKRSGSRRRGGSWYHLERPPGGGATIRIGGDAAAVDGAHLPIIENIRADAQVGIGVGAGRVPTGVTTVVVGRVVAVLVLRGTITGTPHNRGRHHAAAVARPIFDEGRGNGCDGGGRRGGHHSERPPGVVVSVGDVVAGVHSPYLPVIGGIERKAIVVNPLLSTIIDPTAGVIAVIVVAGVVAVLIADCVGAGAPGSKQRRRLIGRPIGRGGLAKGHGGRRRGGRGRRIERPPAASRIHTTARSGGAHLPIICVANVNAHGSHRAACGIPAIVAGAVIDSVIAVLVASGTAAGTPDNRHSTSRLDGGPIARSVFDKR